MIENNREELRDGWIEYLKRMNSKYHLTLVFPHNTNEHHSRKILNALLNNLNMAIYKKRYVMEKSCINGVAIREYKSCMEADHYHIVIEGSDWMPDYEKMNALLVKQQKYFRGDCRQGKIRKNCIREFMLQDYYVEDGKSLENYILKQMEYVNFEYENPGDFIGILGFGKVEFGLTKFKQYH